MSQAHQADDSGPDHALARAGAAWLVAQGSTGQGLAYGGPGPRAHTPMSGTEPVGSAPKAQLSTGQASTTVMIASASASAEPATDWPTSADRIIMV